MPPDERKKTMEGKQKSEVYIRSDGWLFSKDGMDRLVKGGHKGFNRFKENIEAKIGKWHRVLKPLDKEAAEVLMGIKGMIPRAVFLSSAITKEWARRSRMPPVERKVEGRAKFMRLTLTEDAYKIVCNADNPMFREFVSDAICRAAGKRK